MLNYRFVHTEKKNNNDGSIVLYAIHFDLLGQMLSWYQCPVYASQTNKCTLINTGLSDAIEVSTFYY